jgi:hypothetical protein
MESDLENDGYILIRNIIPMDKVYLAQKYITKDKVNYSVIDKYIKENMLAIINNKFGWETIHNKYRVSNNNNSSDASSFHRDIICQDIYYKNPAEWRLNPSMTVLSYLDTTVMEIIPGTHKKPIIPWSEMMYTYNTRRRITINPGDILLFYSTTLHRGIFTENLENRRLIQVFETYKTKEEYQRYSNDIYHVKSAETYSNMMIWLSKQDISMYLMNIVGYLNAAKGYGHITNDMPYLSSEGTRGRLVLDFTQEWQPINKYVFHEIKSDLPEEYIYKFNWYCYNIFFITCFMIMTIMTIMTIYFIIYLYKNYKTDTKTKSFSLRKTTTRKNTLRK